MSSGWGELYPNSTPCYPFLRAPIVTDSLVSRIGTSCETWRSYVFLAKSMAGGHPADRYRSGYYVPRHFRPVASRSCNGGEVPQAGLA